MAKSDGTVQIEPDPNWGTWEDLLLASAVNRYGTNNWESVSVEVHKRRSPCSSTPHRELTSKVCEQKYHDLKRRYSTPHDAVNIDGNGNGKNPCTENIPWVDELRKVRVEELRRELQRYDLSIVSLQMKVKRLIENREQSLRECDNETEKSDLGSEEKRKTETEPEKLSSEPAVKNPVESGKNRSDNESNSTDVKDCAERGTDPVRTGREETVGRVEPDRTGREDEERGTGPGGTGEGKAVGEESCNGSSDSVDKKPEPGLEKVKVEPVSDDSPELESVAESDVQSSASNKTRKGEGEDDKVVCGSGVGDDRENEDQSPAVKGVCVESQPLVDFIERLKNYKHGSVFQRRLESQETPNYGNLIKQHMDLETVRTRLEEGWYSNCKHKFYRDLLLLVNNAIVFFSKKSSESVAAIELRQLISKEMESRIVQSDLSAEKQTSLSLSLPSKPDVKAEPSDPFLLKPKLSGPLIVCRKRSSIASKGSASSSGTDQKREKTAALAQEKPVLERKQPNKSSPVYAEEHKITKKRTRDRFASGSKSLKESDKTPPYTNEKKNSGAISNQNQGRGGSSSVHLEPKSEKSPPIITDVKKKSAANFLNRMKRGSSSNKGLLLESLKISPLSTDNNTKGGSEQKSNGNGRGGGRKDEVSKRSSGGRQAKQRGSPEKKSVGRPPKRAATPVSMLGKRKEGGETEAAASRQPKKRSRK